MNTFPALLRDVLGGRGLSSDEAASTIGAIMDETLSPVRAAALLVALHAKGETVAEVVGAARAMRARSLVVEHGLPLVVDVCGTGGDGASTINISTCVAFVVAGGGVAVAKHGNRSASSACGSADVLEALGVAIDCPPEISAQLLRDDGIAFLFAPRHHPAMRAVAPVRRELGIRTIFNLLGPLTNPAGAQRQIVGVPWLGAVDILSEALRALGGDAGAVVHAQNGLDEIAGDVPTAIAQFDAHGMRRWTLDPSAYGIFATRDDIRGGDALENAAALLAILAGEQSPRADLVALNAALAFVVAGVAGTIDDGLHLARRSIASGAAREKLEALRAERRMEFA